MYMCGICGIITKKQAILSIKDSLNKLQNRGYDSTGIAYIENDNIKIKKYVTDTTTSAINYLNQYLKNPIDCDICIGHTRWATHGCIIENNTHPHFDMFQRFTLVHNGIIENFGELKQELLDNNYKFYGDTDSEIIVNYLSYLVYNGKGISDLNIILQGTWSILFIDNQKLDTIFFMKNKCPLLIGFGPNKTMFSSQIDGFDSDIEKYYILEDMDYGYITESKINTQIHYTYNMCNLSSIQETMTPFSHWTLKEIHDQPKVIANCLNNRLNHDNINLPELSNSPILEAEHLIFLGCGTSHYASLCGAYFFRELATDKTLDVIDAAEFIPEMIPKRKTVVIALSQSGETRDVLNALEIAKIHNIPIIGLINVESSLMVREVNTCIFLKAGRENAVASTKCFTNQVIVLLLMAIWLNAQSLYKNQSLINTYINDLKSLSDDYTLILQQSLIQCPTYIPFFLNHTSCFILGKHHVEFIAKEASLKFKEIGYVHAEGVSASALKHGPFSLLTKNMPVIAIIPNNSFFPKMQALVQEVNARLASVIQITNIPLIKDENVFYYKTNSKLFSLMAIVPLQILAYQIAITKGINPDYPRNLAKVVTVE